MAVQEKDHFKYLAGLLPDEFMGWGRGELDGHFNHDTLFELIDGGAEVYRSLNVKTVISRHYKKAGAPDIIADIFDMGSSKDAFGAFHHDMREGEDGAVGQESEFLGASLSFWKDRYFVSLVAFDETEEVKKALFHLARTLETAIPGKGAPPDLVKLLPGEGLDPRRVHYFHDKMLLDRLYFFGEENLLDLGAGTEGILARYKSPPAREKEKPLPAPALLVVRYPSMKQAKKAFTRFISGYMVDADGKASSMRKTEKHWGAHLSKDLIVGVFEAPSDAEVKRLIHGVLKSCGK